MEWNRFYSYLRKLSADASTEYGIRHRIYTMRDLLVGGHQSNIGLQSLGGLFRIGSVVSLLDEDASVLAILQLKSLESRNAQSVYRQASASAQE